jgi:hypothetical protein
LRTHGQPIVNTPTWYRGEGTSTLAGEGIGVVRKESPQSERGRTRAYADLD